MITATTPGSGRACSGAVLVVALVLLLMMTLLGVSSIDTLSLHTQMVRNSNTQQILHQQVSNELQSQFQHLADQQFRRRILASATDTTNHSSRSSGSEDASGALALDDSDFFSAVTDAHTMNGSITYRHQSNGRLSGYSLGRFSITHYNITVTAASTNNAQRSSQSLGVAHITPL